VRINKSPGPLSGIVKVAGDKSISHRAVMLGALAKGKTTIENFLAGQDCLATVKCLRALGVHIEGFDAKGRVEVYGRGLRGLKEPENVLDAGNSGTTARLMLGILAGQDFFSVITGDDSLRYRPMGRVTKPLKKMGAHLEGRKGGEFAPIAVTGGNLKPIVFRSPVASAQVKSAVLLAGLYAKGETRVIEPYRSRDHTERMLQYFGVDIKVEGTSVRVKGQPELRGSKIYVPGDISSAAYFLVAGAAVPGSDVTVLNVGINPTRSGVLEVLKQMGARINIFNRRQLCGEPVADIRIQGGCLKGVKIGGEMIPRLIDEIPVLAVAAAVAEGDTVIEDAGELKVKETNRLEAVAGELSRMGARVKLLDDGLIISGIKNLKGSICESRGDHRMAMSLAVAGLLAEGETVVKDAGCVDISFPGFFDVLNSLKLK